MNNKDYLDDVLKSVINDSVSNIETSRDIFNEAWNKKEKEMSKRKYFSMEYIKKVALVPACCVAFALIGVFTFSPGARVAAQEVLRTIFILDKSGNIVEKAEDQVVDPDYNVGGVMITDENKAEMEKKLGFSFNFPEKIGEYSTESVKDYSIPPIVGISAKDMKYKDEEELREKFMKAIEDDKTFEELSKDYNIKRNISSSYVDNQGHKFYLYLSKYSEDSKMNFVKDVNINNIKCRILEKTMAQYDMKKGDDFLSTDMTKEPTSVDKVYYMEWNYDGVDYRIYIGKNSSNIDAAVEFAKEYIKILKEK